MPKYYNLISEKEAYESPKNSFKLVFKNSEKQNDELTKPFYFKLTSEGNENFKSAANELANKRLGKYHGHFCMTVEIVDKVIEEMKLKDISWNEALKNIDIY